MGNYEQMTVKQLTAIAEDKGLFIPAKTRKADIIKMIEEAQGEDMDKDFEKNEVFGEEAFGEDVQVEFGESDGFSLFDEVDEKSISTTTFEPLPKGKYSAVIEDVKYKPTKTGKPMLVVQYAVDDEDSPYDGRKIWHNLVIPNGEAYGAKVLKTMCTELGVDIRPYKARTWEELGQAIEDAGELIDALVTIEVSIQKSGDFAGKNQVRNVKARGVGNAFLDEDDILSMGDDEDIPF